MLKNYTFVLLFCFLFIPGKRSLMAQPYCDSTFQIVPGSISFSLSTFSGGDSVLQLSLVNISSGQSLAYPTAKLVPLTPLPAGMQLGANSKGFNTVFASSYVPGDTATVSFYYQVSQSIPVDYTVWFQLWVDGDNHGAVIDSCIVQDSFEVNLNPSVSTSVISEEQAGTDWVRVFSDGGSWYIQAEDYEGKLELFSLAGVRVLELWVRPGQVHRIPEMGRGVFVVRGENAGQYRKVQID